MFRFALLLMLLGSIGLHSLAASTTTPSVSSDPDVGEFVMWDYRDIGSSGVTLSQYHWWLTQTWFADESKRPERFVLYVTSPDNGGEYTTFYDPTASVVASPTSSNLNFVTFLKQVSDLNAAAGSGVNQIEIEVLVDSSSFQTSAVSSCSDSTLSCGAQTLAPPSYFAQAPCVMDWLSTLAQTLDTAGLLPVLGGLTIDPEHRAGPAQSGEDYMTLALWIDQYVTSSSNQRLSGLRYAMTFGVTSKNLGKYTTATFPLTEANWSNGLYAVASGDQNAAPVIQHLDASGYLCWRSGDASPLLDTVYMQVYAGCSEVGPGNIWQWMNRVDSSTGNCGIKGAIYTPRTPAEAAERLGQLLRGTPQTEGPGTVAITPDPTNPTHVTITFDSSATIKTRGAQSAQVTEVPIWQVLADNTHLSAGDFGGTVIPPNQDCFPGVGWKLASPSASGGTITGTGHQLSAPLSATSYLVTEDPIYYPAPGVQDAAMAGRFVFMFSAEVAEFENCYGNPFFGYWTFAEFSAFATALILETSQRPFFGLDAGGTTCDFPLTQSQLGIYDLRFACSKWQLGSYPGYSPGSPRQCPPVPPSQTCCPYTSLDYDGDGEVGGVELAALIAEWGPCEGGVPCWGDLDGSGAVDAQDLQILFGYWGDL